MKHILYISNCHCLFDKKVVNVTAIPVALIREQLVWKSPKQD